ncbi:MAG TPA: sigma factor, partial [Ktedonobacteraceae bacterium]|nr:sigma factor [Ktedonobacteraceae bacterium]
MDSALNASGTLGVIGALAKPVSKTRRKQSSGALTSEGISSRNTSIASPTAVEANSSVLGATVEALKDVELVELVLAGEQHAFEVLVERYKDAVQNLAYRMLGNPTEAEDVTQEVFVRAYTQLATYKPAH